MALLHVLEAQIREKKTKGYVRSLRKQGYVPAVLYGVQSKIISIKYKSLYSLYCTGSLMARVVILDIEGERIKAISKAVQLDPIKSDLIHADFLCVTSSLVIEVDVPVVIKGQGESKGITRGGVLNLAHHQLRISCPAESVPEFIEVNVSDLDIGDSYHIHETKVPDNVKILTDPGEPIISIVAPSIEKEDTKNVEDESSTQTQ